MILNLGITVFLQVVLTQSKVKVNRLRLGMILRVIALQRDPV